MKQKTWKTAALTGLFSLLLAGNALANIKSLEINADMDSVESKFSSAGIAFLPDFEIEDEDVDMLNVRYEATDGANINNPTVGYTLKFALSANDEILDDDLKIVGKGFRASYVDFVSVDNTEAQGRLMVYPFYQLVSPTVTVDQSSGVISWNKVDYAGAYELVISYTKPNGSVVTAHKKTKKTEYNASGMVSASGDHTIAAAVRAIPTEEIGFENAVLDSSTGVASWTGYNGAENYLLRVVYTDPNGKERKHEEKVSGTEKNVQAYINSAKDRSADNVKVTVRALQTANDARYYNIAVSDWGRAGSGSADTSDYEIDDIWELLADYQGVTDGAFAALGNSGTSFGSPMGGSNGTWQREGYRFRYVIDGAAFAGGWKKLNDAWYYFDTDGFMHTGWLTVDGKTYYLTETIGKTNGVMLTGTQTIKGKTYTFGEDGALVG